MKVIITTAQITTGGLPDEWKNLPQRDGIICGQCGYKAVHGRADHIYILDLDHYLCSCPQCSELTTWEVEAPQ